MSKYGNKLPIYPGGGNLLLGERERKAAFGFADLLSLGVSVSLHSPQSVSQSQFALGGEVGQIREGARTFGRKEGRAQ